MSRTRFSRAWMVALATAATLAAGAGASLASAAAEPDTTITVSPRAFVSAPADSPIDFPGVSQARAGAPLHRGYVAVGRDVRIVRGGEAASAALRMTCPKGKSWRSGGTSGAVGVQVLDRRAAGKRSVLVMVTAAPGAAAGQASAGTVYALCR